MKRLRDISLTVKIWAGFACVTLLLVGVAFTGWTGISNATSGFTSYRELARDSNLCGSLQADMLMVRMKAKDYVISSSEQAIDQYNEYFKSTAQFLADAQREINNPVRAEKVDQVQALLDQYKETFELVVQTQTERAGILSDRLNVIGPQSERLLTKIMLSAREDEDISASFQCGVAMRRLLLGRLYVVKYDGSLADSDRQRVVDEFAALGGELGNLAAELQNPARREMLAELRGLVADYTVAFEDLVQTAQKHRTLVVGTLDKIGPQIATLTNDVKLSVKADQDELGPALKASNGAARSMIAVVSLVAIVASVVVSYFLCRVITRPINAVVTAIERASSEKDLTTRLPDVGYDEIGKMSHSLNKFFQQLHGTISSVNTSTGKVSAASRQLNETAEQLNGGASDTSRHSTTAAGDAGAVNDEMNVIAGATEEMSITMRSVADAMDSMSKGIEEIAAGADEAARVAGDASHLTESSKAVVGEMGDSAHEIGKVVGVIQEIAEQTKLLALNATIEAARAGVAGQGFAVVATEVKQLASQTAQATEDIRRRINGMQGVTEQAADSMGKISSVIDQVNRVTANIAATVAKQNETAQDINHKMSETTLATEEVSESVNRTAASSNSLKGSISQVDQSAQQTATGARHTRVAGESLADLANDLQGVVDQFTI